MRIVNKEVVWKEEDAEDVQLFVRHVLIFNDPTAASVDRTALLRYHVHTVLMSFTYSLGPWLVENSYTISRHPSVKSLVAKEVARVSIEAERFTQYFVLETNTMI